MDFPRERARTREGEAASQTLQFPAERAVNAFGHRVVGVGFGCVSAPTYVCMFVLPWSASGLGGGFSSGRPAPVDLCIAAPVLGRKANGDASHCPAAVPRSLSRHHTSRTLDVNQAVLCQMEALTTQKGVGAVFRKMIYYLEKKSTCTKSRNAHSDAR